MMCEKIAIDYIDYSDGARYKAERDMLAQAMQRVVEDIEKTFLGYDVPSDAPAMRWAREFREALGSLHFARGSEGGVRRDRDGQDAENRRVELCAAIGIDIETGWGEAMERMRLRLLPEKMELMTDHDGVPIMPGETRFGLSDGKEWMIDAVGRGFAWSGLSRTAQAKGKRPTRLRPEWLTKKRPDSWARWERELGNEITQQQCGPISPEVAVDVAGRFALRAKSLAESGCNAG